MQSTTEQQHQQQTAVRPHARLRRSHSPLYNYTVLWANDLLAHGPTASPNSSSSTNRLNPIAVHDHMVVDRRRWTRCVCVGFLVCFLVNVASAVFVFVTINSTDDVTDDALLQQFLRQEGSVDVLDRINILRKQNAYLDLGDSVGVSHHKNATPIAIHLRLVSTPSTGKDGEVTGWKPSNRKYLRGLIYENNTGTFRIKLSGVYQVYSQLSFTCPRNKTIVVFKQELRETNTGESLLEDAESIDCSDMPEGLPGHVSFMMSALQLQQGRSLRLYANQLQQLVRAHSLSFFGIFKLH